MGMGLRAVRGAGLDEKEDRALGAGELRALRGAAKGRRPLESCGL